jgi:hypothetical protein
MLLLKKEYGRSTIQELDNIINELIVIIPFMEVLCEKPDELGNVKQLTVIK